MVENFPDLKKETDIQKQEAQQVLNNINPNRPTSRRITIKMSKVKERSPKLARGGREVVINKKSIRGNIGV